MKKQLQRLLLALALLLAPAIAQAQMLGAEDITPVYDLVKTFKRLIPYRDTANHLTVTHVFMSTDYRYIKLSIAYDSDQVINDTTQAAMLDYLVHHDRWSLQPLADHTFDLRLNLFIKGKAHSAQYNYTTADLQQAPQPSSYRTAGTCLRGSGGAACQRNASPSNQRRRRDTRGMLLRHRCVAVHCCL